MSVDTPTIILLFGATATAIGGSFAFTWQAHRAVARGREELFQYKVHAAEYFASVAYAGALERRTVDALTEIKNSLKSQGEKLDRLIERRAAP